MNLVSPKPKSTQNVQSFGLSSYFVFSGSWHYSEPHVLCTIWNVHFAQTLSTIHDLTLSEAFSMYFKTIHFGYFIIVLPVVSVYDLFRMRYIRKSPKGNGNWIHWNNKWIRNKWINGWMVKRTKEWKNKKQKYIFHRILVTLYRHIRGFLIQQHISNK